VVSSYPGSPAFSTPRPSSVNGFNLICGSLGRKHSVTSIPWCFLFLVQKAANVVTFANEQKPPLSQSISAMVAQGSSGRSFLCCLSCVVGITHTYSFYLKMLGKFNFLCKDNNFLPQLEDDFLILWKRAEGFLLTPYQVSHL
jgi:hypothetical protein